MDVKDEIIVQKVKQEILSIDKDAEIVLFGSHARGDARDDSDWDFLFLTDERITYAFRMALSRKMLDIELNENVVLQVVPRNKSDWQFKYVNSPFYCNIEEEGIRL